MSSHEGHFICAYNSAAYPPEGMTAALFARAIATSGAVRGPPSTIKQTSPDGFAYALDAARKKDESLHFRKEATGLHARSFRVGMPEISAAENDEPPPLWQEGVKTPRLSIETPDRLLHDVPYHWRQTTLAQWQFLGNHLRRTRRRRYGSCPSNRIQ